jgi:hypothetical protein
MSEGICAVRYLSPQAREPQVFHRKDTFMASQHHQPNFPNHNPNHQQQRQPSNRRYGPQGNSKEFRRNDLLRRQHDLADEMDTLAAWEQALCAQFQHLADLESRLNGQKGITALSIVFSGGRSVVEQTYYYERSRIAQERLHLQQQWASCQAQKAAVLRKLQRVEFELSLL